MALTASTVMVEKSASVVRIETRFVATTADASETGAGGSVVVMVERISFS